MVLEMEMSKTYQYRKVMKPMLERKRRARINKCLDSLKDLMVECLTQEGEHVTRLEKADILELTVDHMKKLKHRGNLILNSKTESLSSQDCFRSGYVHAADQISKVLATTPGIDVDLGTKLMTYLGQRLNEIQTWTNPVTIDRSLISPDSTSERFFQDNLSVPSSSTFNFQSQKFTPICMTNFPNFKMDYSSFPHNEFKLDTNYTKESVWRPW